VELDRILLRRRQDADPANAGVQRTALFGRFEFFSMQGGSLYPHDTQSRKKNGLCYYKGCGLTDPIRPSNSRADFGEKKRLPGARASEGDDAT